MNPYRESRRAALWGIGVSLALGAVKLIGGLLGHSLALKSDAVHSLVDAAISAALLAALVVAQRPADREHPYGHGRLEAIAGAGVALVLLALAAAIAYESLSTIAVRHAPPAAFTMLIAGGGAFFQELLYRYVSRVARRTGSTALLATAWDYRLDALGGIGVLIGVAMAKWAGWPWADHVAAVLIAGTVLWIGGGLLWENVQSLIDRQADPELLRRVRAETAAVPGVLAVEKLRVRRMGIEYVVEIHIEVDETISVRGGHDIAHAVKDRLMGRIPSISDVVVHVEPSGGATIPTWTEAKSPGVAEGHPGVRESS
ncbi:MAG: cation diffusion facilitator family transporter [Planctomycetota bacterium]|nr:cation diffusion facilitator family transporter [Planctomycetota bacterium]